MSFTRQHFLIFSFCIFMIPACKSVAYFHTSNDMLKQSGTIYLQDGTEKNGEITIFFETGYSSKEFITFSQNGKSEKILAKDVKGYKIKDKYYVPRFIDVDGNGI